MPRRTRLFRFAAVLTCVVAAGAMSTPAHAAVKKVRPKTKAATANSSPVSLIGSPQDRLIRAIVADLDAYWAVELPKLFGVAFTPLRGGYRAASPAVLPPACGRASVAFEDVEDNAFYCRGSDYITWDAEGLFPELSANYGDASIAVVLAHESVHAMQARAKVQLPDVFIELQADCFAGAWMKRATTSSSTLRFEPAVLDDAMRSVLAFRDAPGSDASGQGAHGNGFDRIGSFQEGFENGGKRCARFPVDRPKLTTGAFRGDEVVTGGDVSLDDALALVNATANAHFTGLAAPVQLDVVASVDGLRSALKGCPDGFSVAGSTLVACPSKSTVTVDRDRLSTIYPAVRDGGVAYAVIEGFAALDLRSSRPALSDPAQFTLAIQCLGGSWLGAVFNRKNSELSPGDLDEAIAAAVGLGTTSLSGSTPQVSGYDRIKAMRSGFERGAATCRP